VANSIFLRAVPFFRWRVLYAVRNPCIVLVASVSFVFAGQQPSERYAPLIRALALTDAQVAGAALNGAQQVKLAEIAKVLERFGTAGSAALMGLISVHDWPTGWPCPLEAISYYAREFDLSTTQIAQFEKAREDVRQSILDQVLPKQRRRRELLDSGATENSPNVVELTSELSKLRKEYAEAKPSHEFALSVLNDAQKEKAAAFESDLELARQALELHLIRVPALPEVLCH